MIIQNIDFKYKNFFIPEPKGNDIIHPNCMLCGNNGQTSYKNYIKSIKRNRLIYDKEFSGIHVCRKCSKKLLDTNPSILKKNSNGQKRLSKEVHSKKQKWQEDKNKKVNSLIKMVATCKEKYGEDYYKIKMNKTHTKESQNKRIKTFKQNIKLKKEKFENELLTQIPILIDEIKNNTLNNLDYNNKIHIELVRNTLKIPKGCYIHPILFNHFIEHIKENKKNDYKIISLTSIKRKSRGEIKRGWIKIKNNTLKFDSKAELTFIFENLELFENNIIIRNYKFFKYKNSEKKECKYYPDFYNIKENVYYEIKYKTDYEKLKEIIDRKINTCDAKLCFYEDISQNYKTISKTLIDKFLNLV